MANSKPKPHIESKLRTLHAIGFDDSEMGEAMGFTGDTVRGWRLALGLKNNAPPPEYRGAEKPLTAKTAIEPGWDFSRDNLEVNG